MRTLKRERSEDEKEMGRELKRSKKRRGKRGREEKQQGKGNEEKETEKEEDEVQFTCKINITFLANALNSECLFIAYVVLRMS